MEQPKFDFLAGEVLLINKPYTWTSFDVVNKIRLLLRKSLGVKKIKVGHAGTLDPLATGLLIICTGKATKTIDSIQGQDKTYTGTIFLGATRPSYDMETEIEQTFPFEHIDQKMINETAKRFTGKIHQVPPAFSAIKVDGKRAYEMARKDEDPKLKSREVNIYSFEITNVRLPEVDFEVKCSKGTYIRSLAHDYGKALDSGAFLSNLKRTEIGKYQLSDALSIEQFEELTKLIGLQNSSIQENK